MLLLNVALKKYDNFICELMYIVSKKKINVTIMDKVINSIQCCLLC